jgi:hypothetical protein
MNVTVTVEKTDWASPSYTLTIDNEDMGMRCRASRKLTNTCGEDGQGIFDTEDSIVKFKRDATSVEVDFGNPWSPEEYNNPAAEIVRRVSLVNNAFNEVAENYRNSWTITL